VALVVFWCIGPQTRTLRMTACTLPCTPYRLGLYGVISVDNLDNTTECDEWEMQSVLEPRLYLISSPGI
jgi:hypothetical protein